MFTSNYYKELVLHVAFEEGELCRHSADRLDGECVGYPRSVLVPQDVYITPPTDENDEYEIQIVCPACGKKPIRTTQRVQHRLNENMERYRMTDEPNE